MQVVYGFSENQHRVPFSLEDLKTKKHGTNVSKPLKPKNKLQRRYLEVEKKEATYESQISRLKCNKHCTGDAFKKLNQSSKVRLIFQHTQRCG